jgi:hypothetical protein
MSQERVNREGSGVAPRMPVAHTARADEPGAHAPAAAGEFSLDFSAVEIPSGRHLTGSELDAAVHSFLLEPGFFVEMPARVVSYCGS